MQYFETDAEGAPTTPDGDTWKIVKFHQDKVTSDDQIGFASAQFLHVANANDDQHIIVVRGTKSARDMLEDLTLFSEIVTLQMFSNIYPIIKLWPQKLLVRYVWLIGWSHLLSNAVFDNEAYIEAVNDHVNMVMDTYPDSKEIYVVGH